MKMINRNNAQAMIQKQIKTNDHLVITLATYKRDRKIHIEKSGDQFTLTQEGYHHDTFEGLTEKEMFSLLKKKMTIEFPRSHKLYIAFKS